MDEKQSQQIAELPIKMAVLIERITHLSNSIDGSMLSVKRLHTRIDAVDKMEVVVAKMEVQINHLQKLVYTALAMGIGGLFSLLWTLFQKVLHL